MILSLMNQVSRFVPEFHRNLEEPQTKNFVNFFSPLFSLVSMLVASDSNMSLVRNEDEDSMSVFYFHLQKIKIPIDELVLSMPRIII